MAQNSLKSTDKEIIIKIGVEGDKSTVDAIAAAQRAVDLLKETRKKYTTSIKENIEQEKELKKQLKDHVITVEEYDAAWAQLEKEQQENYTNLAQTNAALKDQQNTLKANTKLLEEQIKAQKDNGDSINAMRAQIKVLRAEYEDLSEAERESAAPKMGVEKLAEIDRLTEKVLELEKAQGDYTRQVGNYELAAKPFKQALREIRIECQNLAGTLYNIEGQITAQKTVVAGLASTLGEESAEYKEQVAILNKLNQTYEQTKSSLSALEQKAGEMADTMSDSNKRIASFANDNQKFVAMQEGVNALSSAYTVLQSSLKALGVESKSMLEIYAKIQVAQQTLNSLLTIYKALNKDSNLMIALKMKMEKTRLIWTEAYNAALAKQNGELAVNTAEEVINTGATGATAVAQTAATGTTFSLTAAFAAFNAVLKANPIVAIASAIVLGVTAIVGVVKKLTNANKEEAEAAKKAKEAEQERLKVAKDRIKEEANAITRITSKYNEEIAKIRALVAVSKSEVRSYKEKKAAIEELNRIIPEFNGAIDSTGKLIQGNIAAIETYIGKLLQKAAAEAYYEKLVDAYKEMAQIQTEYNMALNELGRLQESVDPSMWRINDAIIEQSRLVDELRKKMLSYQDTLWALEAGAGQAVDVSQLSTTTTTTTSKSDNPKVKTAQEQYNELLKIASEYYKSLEEIQKESIQTLTEKENARYEGEKSQLEKAVANAKSLYETLSKDPKLLKELQKDNKFLSLETLQNQIKILNTELDNALKKHNSNLAFIQLTTWATFELTMGKLQQELDKGSEIASVKYTAVLKERLDALNIELQKELDAHEYTEAQKLAITEKYNEKRQQILNQFAVESSLGNYSNIGNLNTLQNQLTADLAELEARKTAELALFEGTEAEKAAIVEKYAKIRTDIENTASEQEGKIWVAASMNISNALASAMGSMSDLLNTISEDNAQMQKYSKALAVAQIAIAAGVSVAQATQAAVQAGGFTGPAAPITIPTFIAELIGIVVSSIASAMSLLKKAETPNRPRFSTGGPVDRAHTGGMIGNKTTTRTDDTIDAKLSEGEYVIQSKVVKKYGIGFFDALNETKNIRKKKSDFPFSFSNGGSVPSVQNIQSITSQMDYSQMEDMFARVVESIQPVVSVREINDMQTRVNVKENIASYR